MDICLKVQPNQGKPDTFYRELTWEQVRYLRKNTVRIQETSEENLAELEDESGGSQSSDDDGYDMTPFVIEGNY